MYARRAIAVAPDIIACHCFLVRFLVGQQRIDEAAAALDAAMALPEPTEAFRWADDATTCTARAMASQQRTDEKAALVAKVCAKYVKLAPQLAQAGWDAEREKLWTEGRAMMDREPKDWPLGQRIFGRLAELEPNRTRAPEPAMRHALGGVTACRVLGTARDGVPAADFWILLQGGACFTYGSGNAPALLKRGEALARQAIDADPVCLGGYCVLARNLSLQGRHGEVMPLASPLLNCRHEEAMKVLLLDAVRCLRIGRQAKAAHACVDPIATSIAAVAHANVAV